MAEEDLKSFTYEELADYLSALGEKPFRAAQIFDWIHAKQAGSFQEMTNISAALRGTLGARATLTVLRPVQELVSKQDGTRKYLFALEDGNVIESVLMRYHHGNSVCISSQVGCRMGCRFCASTIGGRIRNLSPGEMLDQVYRISALTGERISNVVVMGTGEPLDNYESLVRFVRLLSDPRGLGIGRRNITVSTCGIVERIREMARENLGVTLALSLHASSQEKREALMPIAKRYNLEEVLDACRYYFAKTGRRITFEYSLVQGVNDTPEDAGALGALLKDINCHVNLIPVNPVAERSFVSPRRERVIAFQKQLEKHRINATIRREMGRDISGACGQLRRSYVNQ